MWNALCINEDMKIFQIKARNIDLQAVKYCIYLYTCHYCNVFTGFVWIFYMVIFRICRKNALHSIQKRTACRKFRNTFGISWRIWHANSKVNDTILKKQMEAIFLHSISYAHGSKKKDSFGEKMKLRLLHKVNKH